MAKIDFWQIGFFSLTLLLATPIVGAYMVKVFSGQKHILSSILGPIEKLIYRITLVNYAEPMNFKKYTLALLAFCSFGLITNVLLQILQVYLPLNPQNFPNIAWASAFNTAVSFVTNTNWQAYAGESTLSYFTQTIGLSVQNFVSASVAFVVLLVFMRALTQNEESNLGNFFVDMTRTILYLFLPLATILALVLVSQGVLQNFMPYVHALGLENNPQLLPMGPVASFEAIKQLGSNGGGFFGANSAHPYENPNSLTNFLALFAILLIPSASVYMFGIITKARKHAAALYIVMTFFLAASIITGAYCEQLPNKTLEISKNLEGKETRLGINNSIMWAMATTATSNGSVNSMHDSLSPLSGGLALLQIMTGEVIFGGIGTGLINMLLFVILSLFLCGLMIGRSPEYMGKKIEALEIKLALIALLVPCAVVLIGGSLNLLVAETLTSLGNKGPHGLSEILYAWSSAANNNGSAFAGLNAQTNFYNLALALAMLIGRFAVLIPALAMAKSFAAKKINLHQQATFETHGFTFVILLIAIILIIGALTYMPALMLGPIAEYFLMNMAVSF